jgi:hypothetical protein
VTTSFRTAKDPLESALTSTVLFGAVFVIVALIRGIILVASWAGDRSQPLRDLLRAVGFLIGFAFVVGPVVAFTRRRMRAQSLRVRNIVTGGLVGACYALACTLFFAGEMDLTGTVIVGGATFVAVWWAVASGLNQAFGVKRGGRQSDRGQRRRR